MKIRKNSTHIIVYTGAPYGDNEGGHVVSQHQSFEAAKKEYARRFDGTTGTLNNDIYTLDAIYPRGGKGQTAREYFSE